MTDIKPRMVDGVGWCDVECGYYRDPTGPTDIDLTCMIPVVLGDGIHDDQVCPHWAQRMAAWAEEARDLLELDPDAHPDAADLLSRYPGKDGE